MICDLWLPYESSDETLIEHGIVHDPDVPDVVDVVTVDHAGEQDAVVCMWVTQDHVLDRHGRGFIGRRDELPRLEVSDHHMAALAARAGRSELAAESMAFALALHEVKALDQA